MFLATFKYKNKVLWGAADMKRRVFCPMKNILVKSSPKTLAQYIEKNGCDSFQTLDFNGMEDAISFNEAELMAPIPHPVRNVFCVGKNYLDHVKELSDFDTKQFSQDAELPIFFTKSTTCVNSPYGDVPMHENVTSQVDYEAELAVIIGKKGVNIKECEAFDYVFGYTVLNDFTARDLQKDHKQWLKGKSLDGYCPMGPWIVTRDEIGDPHSLEISSYVNDEERQNSNTANMIFSIPTLIAQLSKGMTLLPGDILATGTPSGVGAGFKPPRFLKKGDVVKVRVEAIGEIENRMV